MDNILLSICIPTFNRSIYLDLLLNSISKLSLNTLGKIEICISDNSSTDNTRNVVRDWQNKIPIKYSLNPKNIGAVKNFNKVVSLTNGKYIWVLGDDDIIIPGEVEIFINEKFLNNDIEWFFVGSKDKYNNKLFNYEPIMFNDKYPNIYRILYQYGISYFGFLGHHIFSKKMLIDDLTLYDNHSYPHVSLMISKDVKCISAKKYLCIKSGDLIWNPFEYFFVMLTFILSVETSFFSFRKKNILMMKYVSSKNLLKYLLLASLDKEKSYYDISKRFKKITRSSNFFLSKNIFFCQKLLMLFIKYFLSPIIVRIINKEFYYSEFDEKEGFSRGL